MYLVRLLSSNQQTTFNRLASKPLAMGDIVLTETANYMAHAFAFSCKPTNPSNVAIQSSVVPITARIEFEVPPQRISEPYGTAIIYPKPIAGIAGCWWMREPGSKFNLCTEEADVAEAMRQAYNAEFFAKAESELGDVPF